MQCPRPGQRRAVPYAASALYRQKEKQMSAGNLDNVIVGTCGLCGGPVSHPRVWHGLNRPPETCEKCGASRAGGYGPTLPMNPPKHDDISLQAAREHWDQEMDAAPAHDADFGK